MMTKVKTSSEIEAMRESGRMLATVLDVVGATIKPGITTKELDTIAGDELKRLGGKPSFLGYYDYPGVICISVNEEVVHGIPSSKVIKNGDIVSFDFGVTYKGMITDAARSVLVGPHNKAKQGLIDGTKHSLDAGIGVLKDGVRVGDIAAAVQSVLDEHGFGIVRDLVGHGVGHALHEEPNIPNYGRVGTGLVLSAGMTVAIEPMATLGSYKVYTADDGWTVSTRDGSLAAHFENTVLITENGAEILTTI
jgi:methionyl aminopeptidase